MAKKRFTDVEIWDKEWFMELTPKLKCVIRYLFDKCDASGMWKPNWRLASLQIGEKVGMADIKLLPEDQYEIIDGKIFLPDFIKFQYGTLSENSPAHKPVFKTIEKNNLSDRVFNRVSNTLQEKDKEKEKEKEVDKEEEKDFGKSENLFDPTALVPKMAAAFKQRNPNYPSDIESDFPALGKIAQFICRHTGVSYHPRDGDIQRTVMENWEIISQWIADHDFYRNHNLIQIHRYIQSITTEIKNGKATHKNGKQPTPVKATSSGLHKVFNERYGKGAAGSDLSKHQAVPEGGSG